MSVSDVRLEHAQGGCLMALQHAQAYITDFYDFDRPSWKTPESSFVRHYVEYRAGERSHPPTDRMYRSISPARQQQLRDRVDREIAR